MNVPCVFLVHCDLEHVGNRVHDVRMRAVREDVLDSFVQVLVAIQTTISPRAVTKERIYLRQGDDFRIFVPDVRQNTVENFRFDIIDLRGSEHGTDERG